MTDLQSLAERLRKATGPDRELDVLVWCAVYPGYRPILSPGCTPLVDKHGFRNALGEHERFTASLDAALALVEAKVGSLCWTIGVEYIPRSDHPFGNKACAFITGGDGFKRSGRIVAPTPALALLRALVAALQAQQPEPTRETGADHG